MADYSNLKFVETHNVAGYLSDPPAAHIDFLPMTTGLRNCCISHALGATPVIFKELIADFWTSAAHNRQTDCIEAVVKGEKVLVSEQIIREALQIRDRPEFPSEISTTKILEVLQRMSYEGSFPPTTKKLLPPFWRFLVHTYVSCMSGRKGGTDEASFAATCGFVALTMDWEFNYSRFIFEEMLGNISGKKKDLFLAKHFFFEVIIRINEKHKLMNF